MQQEGPGVRTAGAGGGGERRRQQGRKAATWGLGAKTWKKSGSRPRGMSAGSATGLRRRNSEAEMGATLSHRDTRKSTCTHMSARTHAHAQAHKRIPVHVRPLQSERSGPRGRGRGRRGQRSRPAAPLLGLRNRRPIGRALAELPERSEVGAGASGRGGRSRARGGVCPAGRGGARGGARVRGAGPERGAGRGVVSRRGDAASRWTREGSPARSLPTPGAVPSFGGSGATPLSPLGVLERCPPSGREAQPG